MGCCTACMQCCFVTEAAAEQVPRRDGPVETHGGRSIATEAVPVAFLQHDRPLPRTPGTVAALATASLPLAVATSSCESAGRNHIRVDQLAYRVDRLCRLRNLARRKTLLAAPRRASMCTQMRLRTARRRPCAKQLLPVKCSYVAPQLVGISPSDAPGAVSHDTI